jgi:hypothetical protein
MKETKTSVPIDYFMSEISKESLGFGGFFTETTAAFSSKVVKKKEDEMAASQDQIWHIFFSRNIGWIIKCFIIGEDNGDLFIMNTTSPISIGPLKKVDFGIPISMPSDDILELMFPQFLWEVMKETRDYDKKF